jgi:hypothetical protein
MGPRDLRIRTAVDVKPVVRGLNIDFLRGLDQDFDLIT